jgi:hypothetical protein
MNQQERDALREKHRRKKFVDGYVCAYCEVPIESEDENELDYPCDVIKVLDALEAAERHADNIGDLLAETEKRLGFRITALQTQIRFWRNEAMEGR